MDEQAKLEAEQEAFRAKLSPEGRRLADEMDKLPLGQQELFMCAIIVNRAARSEKLDAGQKRDLIMTALNSYASSRAFAVVSELTERIASAHRSDGAGALIEALGFLARLDERRHTFAERRGILVGLLAADKEEEKE